MKCLFLDVDGVLNSSDYIYYRRPPRELRPPWHIDIDVRHVPHLNAVTDRTGAKLVISSTWRLNKTLDYLRDGLARYGVTGEVLDATPPWWRLRDRRPGVELVRGNEIQLWLDDHPEVTRFAIVDDDRDMAHLEPYLVKTHWDTGLLDAHVEPLVQLLGAP